MAKLNGTKLLLYINTGTAQAPVWKAVLAATSHSLSIDVDLPDASTKGSQGWGDHIQGMRGWSISVNGLHDPAEDINRDEVIDYIENRKPVMVKSSTEETGAKYWQGVGSIASFSEAADMEQPVTFDMEITGNGKLDLNTVGGS